MGDSLIDGLLMTPLRVVPHPKGNIFHALKASSPGYQGFGEVYFSTVHQGMTKGWKRHNRLTLNLVVPVGSVRFFFYDDRPASPTVGRFADHCVGPDDDYVRLTIPHGIWVAFHGNGEFNMLMNVIAEEHDPGESDNVDLSAIQHPGIAAG